jgi:hypothetical protein
LVCPLANRAFYYPVCTAARVDPIVHALTVEHMSTSEASDPILIATKRSYMNDTLMIRYLRQRSYTAQLIQLRYLRQRSYTAQWMTDGTSTGAERQPLNRFHDGADGGPLGRIQTTLTRTGGCNWIDTGFLGQHVVPTYRTNVGWQGWRHRCHDTQGTIV